MRRSDVSRTHRLALAWAVCDYVVVVEAQRRVVSHTSSDFRFDQELEHSENRQISMVVSHNNANSSLSISALVLAVGFLFAACADDQSPASTASVPAEPSTAVEPPPDPGESAAPVSLVSEPGPVSIVGVYEEIEFYPACVNETLDHLGVTWFPIVAAGGQPIDPALQPRVDEILAIDRETSPIAGVQGIVRIPGPGPGDDIGTLVVWDDGVARWVSNSRDLDVWMIDDEIRYMWAC